MKGEEIFYKNKTLFCFGENIVLSNEPLITTTPGGSSLAGFSSTFVALYILLSILLYHFRSCCRRKKVIGLTINIYQKILNSLYLLVIACFEVYWIYGHRLKDGVEEDVPRPTILIVLFWMTANMLSVIVLFIAFCSKRLFRIFMYAAVAFQLPIYPVIILERFIFKQIDVDLIIVFLLAVLAFAQVFIVPQIFKLDSGRIQYEEEQQKHRKQTQYIMMENEMVEEKINKIDEEIEEIELEKKRNRKNATDYTLANKNYDHINNNNNNDIVDKTE